MAIILSKQAASSLGKLREQFEDVSKTSPNWFKEAVDELLRRLTTNEVGLNYNDNDIPVRHDSIRKVIRIADDRFDRAISLVWKTHKAGNDELLGNALELLTLLDNYRTILNKMKTEYSAKEVTLAIASLGMDDTIPLSEFRIEYARIDATTAHDEALIAVFWIYLVETPIAD